MPFTTSLGRSHILCAALVWITVVLLSLSSTWRQVEMASFDALNVLDPLDVSDSPIIIVAIDEPSFADLGVSWPWPRTLHAKLLDVLRADGAAAIAFDVMFSEPTHPAADQALADAIVRANPVVLASTTAVIRQQQATTHMAITPLPLLIDAGGRVGDVRLPLDADGVVRRVPVGRDKLWRQTLALIGARQPEGETGQFIRYAGPPRTFPTVSFYQALEDLLPRGTFRNRLVLVGLSLEAPPTPEQPQADMVATPFLQTTGALLSGVETHATIIEAARQNRLVDRAPAWAAPLLLALCLGAMTSPLFRRDPGRAVAKACLLTLVIAASAAALFIHANIFLPVVAPIGGVWLVFFAHAGIDFASERAQRRFIRRAFGMYVSDAVIDHMLADPARLNLGGERREVTFIFTDVSGFTAMTEQLNPQRTVGVLRDYFEGMTEIVFHHGGTLGQLLGDGMLLFFNAPADQPDHAARAVRCARELDHFARGYARARQAEGIPIGNTRIGVNTGTVIVGNFGSSRRFLYTGIGDAINTAARLESANKFFGTLVCVSASTASACDGIAFRPIGEVRLKGKAHHTPLLEPVAETAAPEFVALYQNAYLQLQQGKAEAAAAAFAELAEAYPHDGLIAFQCRRLADGARSVQIVLTEK